MKKLFALMLGLTFSLTVSASHLLGGMVGVFQTSQDSTSVGVWLVSDASGLQMPNSIYVEKWEMVNGFYTQTTSIQLAKVTTATHQNTNLTNYVSDYLDLDSGSYRFIYKNCCWGMVLNSNNSFNSEFVISADYSHIPGNSTPYAVNPLWVNLQHYAVNTMKPIWGNMNCFLKETDGDSVSLSQDDLYGGYANGVFVSQSFTPLAMHVDNDSISCEL